MGIEKKSLVVGKKPDLSKELMIFDKKKVLENLSEGPKFLIISRKDEGQSMEKVSPFLLRKCINHVVGGNVRQMSALRNGTILVETENVKQAKTLITLKRISPLINLEISEHDRLNSSKGVVNRCYDWKYLTDEEIVEGLREYHVTAIHRIKRRTEREDFVDTGTYFLTFSTTKLPKEIDIGYSFREVMPYIPNPMICFNCLKFNHPKDRCKLPEKICQNCAQTYHLDENEKCSRPALCINCNGSHPSLSKLCPVYIKNKEIQRIKVMENIPYNLAINRYHQMNPFQSQTTFASLLKKKGCSCKCNCEQEGNETNKNLQQGPTDKEDPPPSTSTEAKKNTSAILENKRKNSTDANTAAINDLESEGESEEMRSQSSIESEEPGRAQKSTRSSKIKHAAKNKRTKKY